MTVQLQASKPLATVSPTEFFEDALPKVLAAYKGKGLKAAGTFEINIFGKNGGRWYLDAAQAIVRKSAGEQTDCVLEMGSDDFTKMTTGRLDPAEAMRDGRVRFQGNPDQLVQLGHLLSG